MDNRAVETTPKDPTQLKSGEPKTYIEDQNVAHEAANTVKPLIDERFPPGSKPDKGEQTKYAEELHTEALTKQVRKTLEQEQELNTDRKTGLGSLRKYEKDIQTGLKQTITIVDGKPRISDRERLNNLHILRLDVGFLGYANTLPGEHTTGDRYKQAVADIVGGKTEQIMRFTKENAINFEGYATTEGDEFAVIVKGNKEQVESLVAKIKVEVSKLQIGPDSELPASTSIAMVSAVEFIDNYIEFEENEQLAPDGFYNRYAKFIDQIADFRALYDKYVERMEVIINLYLNRIAGRLDITDYQQLKPYLVKVMPELEAADIKPLVLHRVFGQADLQGFAKALIREKYKESPEKITDPLERFIYETKQSMIDKL